MPERRPNFIVVPRGKEIWRNPIYVKSLALVTPEVALRDHGLVVDQPVLTTDGGTVDTPLVWQRAGQVLEAPRFAPSRAIGIAFEAHPAAFLTNGSMSLHEVQLRSWAAIIDPVGRVWTGGEERVVDYRYAKAVRIKEIMAHCYRCLDKELGTGIPISGPMQEGIAVDAYRGLNGQGNLVAICGLEKHPEFTDLYMYNFKMSEEGELVLSNP